MDSKRGSNSQNGWSTWKASVFDECPSNASIDVNPPNSRMAQPGSEHTQRMECSSCGYVGAFKQGLKNHDCLSNDSSTDIPSHPRVSQPGSRDSHQVRCDTCGYVCMTKQNFEHHRKNIHPSPQPNKWGRRSWITRDSLLLNCSNLRMHQTSKTHNPGVVYSRAFVSKDCDAGRLRLENEQRQADRDNIFQITEEDELPGYSKDDTPFLTKTIPQIRINEYNSIEMLFPFRNKSSVQFPDNRKLADSRTKKKIDQLNAKNPEMLRLATEKMAQNICEYPPKCVPVPPWAREPQPGKAYWISIIIIPSKGKVRLVFDAATRTAGNCLNDAFLQGPNCNNAH